MLFRFKCVNLSLKTMTIFITHPADLIIPSRTLDLWQDSPLYKCELLAVYAQAQHIRSSLSIEDIDLRQNTARVQQYLLL